MVIAATSRLRWGPVLLLPLLAVAAWAVIADWPPAVAIRGTRRNIPAIDRWREPTEDDEYAARSELRRALTAWQTLIAPSAKFRSDASVGSAREADGRGRMPAIEALLILCPQGGDPIEAAWQAVNRPFQREVPESAEKMFRENAGGTLNAVDHVTEKGWMLLLDCFSADGMAAWVDRLREDFAGEPTRGIREREGGGLRRSQHRRDRSLDPRCLADSVACGVRGVRARTAGRTGAGSVLRQAP